MVKIRDAMGVVLIAWRQATLRQAPLLAAGVAFYGFTSLFPALIAGISIYGLVVSAETVERQVASMSEALPPEAAKLIGDQLTRLVSMAPSSLGWGAALAIILALWTASAGTNNLIVAINQMYGLRDDRGFVRRRALSIVLTISGILFVATVAGLATLVPYLVAALQWSSAALFVTEIVRWALTIVVIIGSVGVLFRVAPNRPGAGRHLTAGVILAAAAWLTTSVGFAVFASGFGNYDATYGTLAGVIVLLLWLWLGILALLLGAAVEATREGIVTRESIEAERELGLSRVREARDAPIRTDV